MYAVYESAFQMVSDHPAAYKDQPAFEFIKNAPATWAEPKVVNSVPGEYLTIARRHGQDWFLGSMTNWSARTLDVPLAFLGAGRYNADIYADAEDAGRMPKNIRITKRALDRNTRLNLVLAPGGGCAIRFVPAGK